MNGRFGWKVGDLLDLEEEESGSKEFGGEGSGNFDHAGRPGEVGGSAPGGGVSAEGEEYLRNAEKDPEVQKARQEMGSQETATAKLYKVNGFYVPDRKRLQWDVVREVLNPKAKAKEGEKPKAIFIIGPPGSGKSETVFKQLKGEFTHVDADEIKRRLPEYSGKNAARLHEESGDVAEKMLLPKAIRERHSVVIDQVGKNTDKVERQMAAIKRSGYDIELHYIEVNPVEAAKRAMQRYRHKGRWVDPEYIIRNVDSKPEMTYQKVKKLANRYVKYNNEVPRGQEAKIVERKG